MDHENYSLKILSIFCKLITLYIFFLQPIFVFGFIAYDLDNFYPLHNIISFAWLSFTLRAILQYFLVIEASKCITIFTLYILFVLTIHNNVVKNLKSLTLVVYLNEQNRFILSSKMIFRIRCLNFYKIFQIWWNNLNSEFSFVLAPVALFITAFCGIVLTFIIFRLFCVLSSVHLFCAVFAEISIFIMILIVIPSITKIEEMSKNLLMVSGSKIQTKYEVKVHKSLKSFAFKIEPFGLARKRFSQHYLNFIFDWILNSFIMV